MARVMTRDELARRVEGAIRDRYIDRHPLMQLLYRGGLSKKQLRAWIVNRFYMQNSIGSKDAAILSNCPVPEVRRLWISRSVRREGLESTVGDVEGWLALAEAAGLRRENVQRGEAMGSANAGPQTARLASRPPHERPTSAGSATRRHG